MCRNILWCYTLVLTLLDISLKTKLTAQGESHGVTIHDSLVEGITFQEWGKESGADGLALEGEGEGDVVEGVSLEPRALRFGRAALAAPHARTVTLTNTANTTLHLASVAGTTPDFHASFFESKTLPPQGNTTFSVVYLGRREGPVSAHLYIHTSLGVHKYPVSAVGEASPFGLWPLVGVRVPLNASVEPELRLRNPTDVTVQVREVYASGAWLRLRLPGGGERAPRDAWAVPPRSERALVALRLAPHALPPLAPPRALTAYVRIKADIPGGGLVVAVEARSVAPGEHARPLHVRLRARGAGDPPHTVELAVANSADAEVSVEGGVRGAGCWRAAPPAAPCDAPAPPPEPRHHNGGTATGAHLTLLRSQLAPRQEFTPVAHLTLNYAELWAQMPAGEAQEAWCGGCVRLGRAAVPFSVRLLPGALRLAPERLDIVTAAEDAMREREVRARNEFKHALRIDGLRLPADVAEHFHVVDHTPVTLRAGALASLLHLRLRAAPPDAFSLSSELTVFTNLSEYTVPIRMYSGKLLFEWEWAGAEAAGAALELGTLGASWTRRVGARVRNPAPVPLCVRALGAALPGAAAGLALQPPDTKCVEPGGSAAAWLTVVAPAREGALRGLVYVNTTLASSAAALALRVRAGHARALPLALPPAAPYAGSSADLEVESSMAVRMRVTSLRPLAADPALTFQWEGEGLGDIGPGRQRVARVTFAPELRCAPRCYTGLQLTSDEGAAWLRRGQAYDEAALRDDVALLLARFALFQQQAPLDSNFTLHLHTTEVQQLAARGAAALQWPRLAARRAGEALAAVRRAAGLRLALRNVARAPLLLHALLAPAAPAALPAPAGGDDDFCATEKCEWSPDAFRLSGWRVTRGAARLWNETDEAGAHALPALLLEPGAELEVSVTFAPRDTGVFTAHLYLRNNLTVLESVQLYGRGEYPSFDIAGRPPDSSSPFVFEVKECAWNGAGAVSRRVVARNAGRVGVSLSRWAVARDGCAARGFRVSPCAPLALPPNASAPLHLAFSPDYTLARVTASLQLQTDLGPAEYLLMATVPAKVLSQCAAITPRPPWENMLRAIGTLLAFGALAAVLFVAAMDAERLLRRARAARCSSEPRAPLDLRDLRDPADTPSPPAPLASRAPSRRRRSARRPLPPLDPRAERRAFERWRTEVLRREDESSRSSEDADLELDEVPSAVTDDSTTAAPLEVTFETEPQTPAIEVDGEPEVEPSPVDEDVGSSGSDASTPTDDRDDADEPYGGDVEPDPRDDSPTEGSDVAPAKKPIPVRPLARTPPAEAVPRAARPRRDAGDGPRRPERPRPADAGSRRGAAARPAARKERPARRRGERAPPSPPPRSPAPAPGDAAEARAGVRLGASWSSVVAARGAPLAPIGSDVRRREPERAPDNSLFYFNGTTEAPRPDAEFAWRPPVTAERPAFAPPARDYLEEPHSLGVGGVGVVGAGYGAGLGAVWGGGWGAWGAGPLRPPPGFAPPSPPSPPAQRSYDPFRSLASIWAPVPHDWRPAAPERDDRN